MTSCQRQDFIKIFRSFFPLSTVFFAANPATKRCRFHRGYGQAISKPLIDEKPKISVNRTIFKKKLDTFATQKKSIMAKNLVIVESPAKAKTIEKFLGSDYQVESSYGHIADLPSKEIGVDVANGFKPRYEVSADKKALVSKLKTLSKNAEMVWLASDEDREGEAISWHLAEELKLDKAKTKRIVFHEITKTAILKAIDNPREIDYNLVNAQQARRVLDRLVGYELSPVLWRKSQKEVCLQAEFNRLLCV